MLKIRELRHGGGPLALVAREMWRDAERRCPGRSLEQKIVLRDEIREQFGLRPDFYPDIERYDEALPA